MEFWHLSGKYRSRDFAIRIVTLFCFRITNPYIQAERIANPLEPMIYKRFVLDLLPLSKQLRP